MYIKSVSDSIKDVFLGKGWNNWVRIDLDSQKVVKASVEVTPILLKSILGKIHK